MKKNLTVYLKSGILSGLALCPFSYLSAVEAPPDDAIPPVALQQRQLDRKPFAESRKEIPYLGISTATLPDMVADHLNIESGVGVIVRTVAPASPAEKSGLVTNDIILEINDSPIGNPEALSSLIGGKKVGDLLALKIIHKGQPLQLEATLSERPTDQVAGFNSLPLLEGVPRDHANRLRDLIEQNLGAYGQGGLNSGIFPDAEFESRIRKLRERMNRLSDEVPQIAPDAGRGIQFQQKSTVRMMDGDGSVEIQSSGNSSEVIVRDTQNKIIWQGPWNTPEEKAAAPELIRNRIDQASSSTGKNFSFRFGKLKPKSNIIEN